MHLPNISNKTILISVLDWGFGHITRCVPIIQILIKSNNRVVFAGSYEQIKFISNEFPTIETEFLEGYNVQLASNKNTYFQVLNQLYKISVAFKTDGSFVKEMGGKYNLDLILSDNRYGFRNSKIESIFIGHQLVLELPRFKRIVNYVLTKFINQFSSVWVVDDKALNLAGQLSSPVHLNVPYKYIGLLSRFVKLDVKSKYDYLFSISGPNPENAIFLKAVESLISDSTLNCAIVSTVQSVDHIIGVDYFYETTTKELNALINEAEVVISKSGYTTLMELTMLRKQAILIPTKGQFEQEYLANYIKNDSFQFVNTLTEIKSLFD
jgi:uncharacterized protein (TIGR00661 family)